MISTNVRTIGLSPKHHKTNKQKHHKYEEIVRQATIFTRIPITWSESFQDDELSFRTVFPSLVMNEWNDSLIDVAEEDVQYFASKAHRVNSGWEALLRSD